MLCRGLAPATSWPRLPHCSLAMFSLHADKANLDPRARQTLWPPIRVPHNGIFYTSSPRQHGGGRPASEFPEVQIFTPFGSNMDDQGQGQEEDGVDSDTHADEEQQVRVCVALPLPLPEACLF